MMSKTGINQKRTFYFIRMNVSIFFMYVFVGWDSYYPNRLTKQEDRKQVSSFLIGNRCLNDAYVPKSGNKERK